MKKKTLIFKKQWWKYVTTMCPGDTLCDCCGASYDKVDDWTQRSYFGADGASGRGILITAEPTNLALLSGEKQHTIESRNGTFYITTKQVF